MNTTRNSSHRFVVMAVVTVLMAAVLAVVLLSPGRSAAQASAPRQAEPRLPQSDPPPSPPPALNSNRPAATPDPDAVQASAAARVESDLEVVRFRPDATLRRGESPALNAGVEKNADVADSGHARQLSGETRGPQQAYQAPDVAALLSPLEWQPLLYEGFEGAFPGDWVLEDWSDDGFQRTWGGTDYGYYYGDWSIWPAAYGADALDPWVTTWYTDNLNSWIVRGPFDFGTMSDVFVSFGLYYHTEPDWDWMHFCASIDGLNFYCDYWSGWSEGWTDQAYWLTSYAGYSQVWLAWVFQSDSSISSGYYGPYVDEIWVWGDSGGPPVPTPTPDPNGELVQNGSFETGDLTSWSSYSPVITRTAEQAPDGRSPLPLADGRNPGSRIVSALRDVLGISEVDVTSNTAVEGNYSAYLWRSGDGDDFLYQTLDVPTDTNDVVLNFWFAVTTYEATSGNDWFCVSMSNPSNHNDIWVDLGCMDAYYTTGYWQEVWYPLDSAEVAAIAGQSVDLVYELYNRGGDGTGSAGWADYVRVYAIGGGGAEAVDPNEPNDSASDATAITCGTTISGTIGDAMGGYGDLDVFRVDNVSPGQLDVDIKADTQVPPSALDSVVGFWDDGLNLLAWNDDDSVSYDSYVTYTVVSTGTFYVSVESYSGYGGPDSFYDLTVQCAGSGGGPPIGGNDVTPVPTNTWTIMLYLNAEDASFESTLRQYITDIEGFIGSKSDFLNVAVLFDGPTDGDTRRYLVQANGVYTDGVNRWDLGELNMGHPDTLAGFANWAMDQYPAESYYLALDDHGHGVYGISWDHTDGDDSLTPPEVYSALKDITNNGARKIDIMDYEACLMGMAEHAYDVREWVDYVVFFEQISWGIDTYPQYFSDLAATDTPLGVGTRIIQRYNAEATSEGYPHTISLIDTSHMLNVKQAVTDLGDALQATGDQGAVESARDQSQAFAADDDATNPQLADYIDLWDLADETAGLSGVGTAATQVKTAVQNAVAAEEHYSDWVGSFYWDHSGVHGLSIYYPPSNASGVFADYTAPRLFKMSEDESGVDGHWDEFLLWAVGTGGNGAGNGLGGGDRRGMGSFRFLQPKLSSAEGMTYLYLPLVLQSPAPSGVTNGNFESGSTGWVEYSTHEWDLIVTSFPPGVTPHNGSWAVWLGGDHNDISYIQQQVTVPPGSPYLAYWHWIASADSCGHDLGGVVINGSVVDVYDLCESTSTGAWVQHVVNLSAYAGQSVSLQIRAETNASLNSNLFIDDVAFQTSASSVQDGPTLSDSGYAMPKSDMLTSQDVNWEEAKEPEFLFQREMGQP
jgi:hypothetical protein